MKISWNRNDKYLLRKLISRNFFKGNFDLSYCAVESEKKNSSIQRKRITIEKNIMGTILPSEILE